MRNMDAIHAGASGWGLALRFARREIRGSIVRFRVFVAALMLGVAAIGTVGSLAESMRIGIADNARIILGGDLELRSAYNRAGEELMALATSHGRTSQSATMRAMLEVGDERKLVSLRAVDESWPLLGAARTGEGGDVASNLGDGRMLVAPQLMLSLGLEAGQVVNIAGKPLIVSDTLTYEPDRTIGFFSFGPRVMISMNTLRSLGLEQPGAVITHSTRIAFDNPDRVDELLPLYTEATHQSPVRVLTLEDAAPGIEEFINATEVFLVLVGLTALLIGGLGIAGGVRAWLGSRVPVIATLKCLGAPKRLIFRIYLLQVMLVSAIGVLAGVVIAAVAPTLAYQALSLLVALPITLSLYPQPLATAAGFGMATAFLFVVWPLAKAGEVRAADLFRQMHVIPGGRPGAIYLLACVLAILAIAALAFVATGNIGLTAGFIGGSLVVLFVLGLLGEALIRVLGRVPAPGYVPARLALSAIKRAGPLVRSVIIAFGLGLSVLVAVALTQTNLTRQINVDLTADAPDWFFVGIQSDQIDELAEIANRTEGVTEVIRTPTILARVTELAGKDARDYDRDNEGAWVLRGDRALTWLAEPPADNPIAAGEWWPADYDGPPLVSMAEDEASDLGVWVGDEITFNILGRSIDATISNIRYVDWDTFSINFVFILSPGILESAPHGWMASIRTDSDEATARIERNIGKAFANVSAVSVRETINSAQRIVALLVAAVQITALVTLFAGIAVLAGTVANTEAQRLSDSVILKVLGATRFSITIAWFLEYALLGLLAAVAAAIIGSLAGWALVTFYLDADFEMNVGVVVSTTLIGAVATAFLGLAGAVRTLGRKPGPLLREV